MRDKEKLFLKAKTKHTQQIIKYEFLAAQKLFDRILRIFERKCLQHKQSLEDNMVLPSYVPNRLLNKIITREVVAHAILNSKEEKTPGFGQVYYEVIKNYETITVLQKVFQLCFQTGKVLQQWEEGSIHPIPKDTQLDPRIPSNYRGISLLSVVVKCYS